MNQGNKVDFHGKPSVRNSAPIQVTFGYTTTSVKKVEEIGNPDKYAFPPMKKHISFYPERTASSVTLFKWRTRRPMKMP